MEILFMILEIVIGLISLLIPEKIASFGDGKKYDYDEVSEESIYMTKLFGFLSFILGIVGLISILQT